MSIIIVAEEKAKKSVPAHVLCEALNEDEVVLFSATAELVATIEGTDLVVRPVGRGLLIGVSHGHLTVHKTRISCGRWEVIKAHEPPIQLDPGWEVAWWPRLVTTSVVLET